MRHLFTTEDARRRGLTMAAIVWGERTGRWRRIVRSVYGEGSAEPDELDRARAQVLAAHATARGALAAVLHGLDGVALDDRPIRRDTLRPDQTLVIARIPTADGFQTLIDLAALVDDDTWEQALESAVRKRLTTVAQLEAVLPALGRSRARGTARIRRVLERRPPGAPATESLLETLMVQLAREVDGLPDPTRQFEIRDSDGVFVARVDLCWPDLGLFIELDGQHHEDQPVYDARRETAVIAATAWLPGRFTWREVVHLRRTTTRRLGALAHQARNRPLASPAQPP